MFEIQEAAPKTKEPTGDRGSADEKSDAADTRTWTDKTDKFKVEARFRDYKDGYVLLELTNGQTRSVRLALLSEPDQTYVRGLIRARRDGKQAAADASAPPEKPGAVLTVEQRKQLKVLIDRFRRARGEQRQRDELMDVLFKYGDVAVRQLQELVDAELHGHLQEYAGNYMRRASGLYRSRLTPANAAQVQRLRNQVLALKDDESLTRQRIVAEGDPAIDKLRNLLVIPRETVLEDEVLRAKRAQLVELSQSWQRIQEYFLKKRPVPIGDGPQRGPSFEDHLRGEEDMAAQLAMPMQPANRRTLAANARLETQIGREEARAVMACNLMRNLLGLNVLAIDLKLCTAARDHSKDMTTLKFFAHESPVQGKKTFADRAANFGTTSSGENILKGTTDGNQASLSWFHSPGHHKNMLGSHNRVGVGRHEVHFTKMFGN